MTPDKLEGVRPRNAVCPACGYGLAGIEIRRGVIICPECATPAVFELKPGRPPDHGLLRAIGLILGFALVALALALLLA